MMWGRQVRNGTDFTMPLATWNHLVITINQNSEVNIYLNNVFTLTETILSEHATGTLINPSTANVGRRN
jgi:hypothetical protein